MPANTLFTHLQSKTGFGKHYCCKCYEYFESCSEKFRHCSKHSPTEIRCTECLLYFRDPWQLLAHEEIHRNCPGYHSQSHFKRRQCRRCGKIQKTEEKLTRHLLDPAAVCTEFDKTCRVCFREIDRVEKFLSHIELHWAKECPRCSKVTENAVDGYRHLLESEKCLASRVSDTTLPCDDDGVYRCKFCRKEFTQPIYFQEHQAQHVETRNLSCPKCPKTFNTAWTLKSHITGSHTLKTCDKCNKEFKPSYIRMHYCEADPELAEQRRRKCAEDWAARKKRRLEGIGRVKCEICAQ